MPKPADLRPLDPVVYFYRYEDRRVGEGYVDECGDYNWTGSHTEVRLRKYRVAKFTPTGVWLFELDRFVSTKTNKKFACATIEEAKVSFLARKARQIDIHRAIIARAEEAIKLIEKGKFHV
jgi:hypothetical protein